MYHSHEAHETPELNSLEFSSDRLLKQKMLMLMMKGKEIIENQP